ncbi:hypothetical protein WICMUC_001577 [Wickerhamomyces mucosus]|uniref:Major facilitator superfamily (MFS) profile domain-containing protein n=1 Tax=Wickerhamomyces mucosus TaxID=1378264 RepID=A0A9P8PW40_9ASCO|nr:hypothetical protein WICMUC_001577 [Wickerhamomyces mucosus]
MSGSAFRDVPTSVNEFFSNPIKRIKKEITLKKSERDLTETEEENKIRLEQSNSLRKRDRLLPIFTAGAGLFSDGYVNNSIGTVSTCLSLLYPHEYKHSNAIKNVSSIAFVGMVVGQLSFGLVFFIGIGLGSEYPAGSTACAEASALLPPGKRNRYFAFFTNFMIDFGFVVSAFVPMVLLWICTPKHLTPVWRITLGLGAIPPISLFILRLYYTEGETFSKTRFKKVSVPYSRVVRFYWFRLLTVSLIWFIYDFSAYAFGLFSSYVIANLYDSTDLYQVFGWNVVFNLFYMPGAFLGAFASDYLGPRLTLIIGVSLQSIVGYILAGAFESAQKHVGGFVVAYGIFMTLGEFGPGDNIGLLASKTSATAIRGQYYGIASAVGKVGAFIGTYCFTPLINNHGIKSAWWLASSLGLFSAILAFFFIPPVDQAAMQREDARFLEYLESTGFDISQLGDDTSSSLGSISSFEEKVVVNENGEGKN